MQVYADPSARMSTGDHTQDTAVIVDDDGKAWVSTYSDGIVTWLQDDTYPLDAAEDLGEDAFGCDSSSLDTVKERIAQAIEMVALFHG